MADINEIVELMANIINYLNSSFYEGLFNQKHEEARANINAIYDTVSKTQSPTKEDCVSFYQDLCVLTKVTDTDDPDYYIYMRQLRRYIQANK
jgi:hypothetical protein